MIKIHRALEDKRYWRIDLYNENDPYDLHDPYGPDDDNERDPHWDQELILTTDELKELSKILKKEGF